MVNNKDVLRSVIKYIKRYLPFLVLSLVCAVIYALLSLYVPKLAGYALDYITGKGSVNMEKVVALAVRMGIITCAAALAWHIMGLCNNKITYNVIKDIRKDAFCNIQHLSPGYLDTHSHGDMVSRIIADTDTFADGLLLGFSQFFTGVVTIIATIVFMITISPEVTAVVVILTPISLFVASFIAKRTYGMFKKQSETRGRQTAFIDEMIGNIKVVKAYGHEEEALLEFERINDDLKKDSLKAVFFSSITNPSTRFVNGMVYAAVALVGGYLAIKGRGVTVGGLTTLLSYANQYTKPFNEISGVVTELQNALACASRIFQIINETPETADKEKTLVPDGAAVKGNIDVDNVSFSYVPGKKLIENLNVHVKSGGRVAIVGPTGCGKTTVINLLMRFYDVDGGEIKVDEINIKNITRRSLRENYGMVLQETWLKSGTIKENIAMGKEEATDEEIIAAAKSAHAHSFIRRLEKGYDTVIGDEGGMNLSAGQKQLLCIARVMLCLPPMLILDEATSSIDTRTEIKIQKAFAHMMKGRTSFIVAHRLSTIQDADMILVMKDGNVIEQGKHAELLNMKGFYYNLYNSRFET